MHHSLIADLAIVLGVAAVTGLLSRRLGQPSVLGYLLAGLIVGPYIPVPLFADPHRIEELAEVGVVLVMFAVGLEFRVRRLLEILPLSGFTALVQIAALSWAGFHVAWLLGWSTQASITLGAALAISSTMVVSAVFASRPIEEDVRAHVLGVLVVQDVVAILLLAVVTGMAAGTDPEAGALGMLVAELSALVVVMLGLGVLALPRMVRWVFGDGNREGMAVLVVGVAFGFALAAESFGFSVALGAFIAGIAVAESGRGHEIDETIGSVKALFSALFFVSIGMAVDPRVALESLPLALLLVAIVVGGQLVAVSGASLLSGLSIRRSILSGLALGQIGELSFILATVAVGGGLAPDTLLPALVTVATVTTFTTPFLLGRADRIVHAVDHHLPDRGHELLTVYGAFLRRVRTPGEGPSLRGPALAALLDWGALLILFVVRHTVLGQMDPSWATQVNLGVALLAAPFVVGLVRSGVRAWRAFEELIAASELGASVHRSVELLVLLATMLAFVAPTLALLQPLFRGGRVEGVLVAAMLVGGGVLVRGMGRGSEFSSGVATIAVRLGALAEEEAHEHAPHTADPLAGLDYVSIEVAGEVAGRTLAELDLRSRTGATVVAIVRADQSIPLPTGHERLEEGDVVAVSGSKEAVARAMGVLG